MSLVLMAVAAFALWSALRPDPNHRCPTCGSLAFEESGVCLNDYGTCADCGVEIHGHGVRSHRVFGKGFAERYVCSHCRWERYDKYAIHKVGER